MWERRKYIKMSSKKSQENRILIKTYYSIKMDLKETRTMGVEWDSNGSA